MSRKERYMAHGQPPMKWRNCVKPVRERLGVSQTELANRAGLFTSNLAAIETHARQPSVGTLLRIAFALGCTVDDLIELEPYGREERFISRCGDVEVVNRPSQQEEPQ